MSTTMAVAKLLVAGGAALVAGGLSVPIVHFLATNLWAVAVLLGWCCLCLGVALSVAEHPDSEHTKS